MMMGVPRSWRRQVLSALAATVAITGTVATVVERVSILRPWTANTLSSDASPSPPSSRGVILGWTKERRDPAARRYEVLVGWNYNDKVAGESESSMSSPSSLITALASSSSDHDLFDARRHAAVSIYLPYLDEEDSLASSLWPGSLAAAILCRSPALRNAVRGRRVLELGSGLGLTGLAAAAAGASACTLTDHDQSALLALRDLLADRRDFSSVAESSCDMRVEQLDWRDEPRPGLSEDSSDVVVASDVAYYHHLLRPLMDAARSHLRPNDSLWLAVGQANREVQWELHRALRDGCYNPRTDEREGPWPGITETLLYRLDMYRWQSPSESHSPHFDGTLPIAALLHQTPRASASGPPFVGPLAGGRWDHAATDHDVDALDMSF